MKSVVLFFVVLVVHASFASSYLRGALDIKGPVASVFTPFYDDQNVNFDAIYPYADFIFDNDIQYVSVGVEASEIYKMALEDVKKVVRTWVDACTRRPSKKLGVIVHVGAAPFQLAKQLAQYSASLGVTALVVLPDLIYKPTNMTELVDYVGLIAAAAPHTSVLYHHLPKLTGVNVNMPDFVKAATAKIPNFEGLWFGDNDLASAYESWSELEYGQKVIFEANEVLAASSVIGMCCSSGAIYNLFPKLAQNITNSIANCDFETAKEVNYNLATAAWTIKSNGPPDNWFPALKAAMEIVTGINMGPPALPERPISLERKEKIRQGSV